MIVYNYDADLEVSDTCVRSSLLSWVELSWCLLDLGAVTEFRSGRPASTLNILWLPPFWVHVYVSLIARVVIGEHQIRCKRKSFNRHRHGSWRFIQWYMCIYIMCSKTCRSLTYNERKLDDSLPALAVISTVYPFHFHRSPQAWLLQFSLMQLS